ncbi:MAG: NAD(P)-dependent oxidoreductase [Hydrogenophilales bacterium]
MRLLKQKKILVTGCSGQIGKNLIPKLIELGLDVYGLDLQKPKYNKFYKFLLADLTDSKSLLPHSKILSEIDLVIHLASKIENTQNVVTNLRESIEINIEGTINLIEFLTNVEHVFYASSYMVYGNTDCDLINEKHNTNPTNIYGSSKLTTEKFLQVFANKKKFLLTIFRFMGIFGPDTPTSERAIPTFIELIFSDKSPTIIGNGKNRRNHIYLDDAINAIINSLKFSTGGIFNLGGKESPNNLELISIINEIMNKKIEPIFKNQEIREFDFILDNSLAIKKINYNPTTGIKNGLTNHIESLWRTK